MKLVFAVIVASVGMAMPVYAQAYEDGPPLNNFERQYVPTWQGYTRFGATIYFDASDGTKGVLWQPRQGGSWFYKTSDGQQGGITQQDLATVNGGGFSQPQYTQPAYQPAYQPQQTYRPPQLAYRPPAMSQDQVAAYAIGMYLQTLRAMFSR